MQKKVVVFLIGLFCLLVIPVYSAEVKIAVIDFQTIFDVSEIGKAAKDDVNRQGEKMAAEVKKKRAELEEMKKQLERDSMVGNKTKLEEKARDFRIKVEDFKFMEQKYNDEFRKVNGEAVNRIQGEVMVIIQEIGKKEGYTLILEKRETGTLYLSNQIDITDRIIQLANEKFKQKKK
ncbi:MAG: OmpH family outer membrane protein [Desulfobacterales bacterium]|nr:OmpH family outer membrane protein [Desulfobacterales bacterium]MBF0396692.1 OmpH family outer membrane protein [Desulfobacterales bacterium]